MSVEKLHVYGFCLSIPYIARRHHPYIESLPTLWYIYIYICVCVCILYSVYAVACYTHNTNVCHRCTSRSCKIVYDILFSPLFCHPHLLLFLLPPSLSSPLLHHQQTHYHSEPATIKLNVWNASCTVDDFVYVTSSSINLPFFPPLSSPPLHT